MSVETEAPAAGAATGPGLSLGQRVVRIFVRPADAWRGLEGRPQWWFPLILSSLVAVAFTAALYHRAMVPMQLEMFDRMVESGKLPQEQAQVIADKMGATSSYVQAIVRAPLGPFVVLLFQALIVWLGVGFILGGKFRYRLALETVAWASLVNIPSMVITGILAWFTESMDVRLGFGALMPSMHDASALQSGITLFLEAIGPFAVWYLFVLVLGASALSGLPRKNVAWVLVSLYLALSGLFAAVGAMFLHMM